MDSPNDQLLADFMSEKETREIDTEESNIAEEGENDPFLKFIDYAKSILYENGGESEDDSTNSPGWSWISSRILRTCVAYSSGVTPAILLSELALAWHEQNRSGAPKKLSDIVAVLKKKHKRAKLPNTITIDSIHEKKFLSLSSVIEAVVIDAFTLPGTNIYMLTLGDIWSSNTIDLYLHRRFYNISDPKNGILRKGREIFLTGCYLRVAAGNSTCARLLPTEYFAVLLDEIYMVKSGENKINGGTSIWRSSVFANNTNEVIIYGFSLQESYTVEDDDAMLLGAHFCSDSFSSISLDAVNEGTSYSLFARIEHIGSLEIQGKYGSLQRKQITLVDNDGVRLKFLLWGEQALVANLFSLGSMLALDRPFIASAIDSSLETNDDICLEYGSATQLYLVPLTLRKEQVSVALTQNNYQGSRLLTHSNLSQGQLVSQVTLLPRDSQGSIDFSNCPVRSCVVDLRDKMTGISLYGNVTGIRAAEGTFSLRIADSTGAIWVKLHFVTSWSLGRLGIGHTVYLSNLSSLLTPQKSLELSWYKDGTGSLFFNLSRLPVFLNTTCLHRLLRLSDLSKNPKCAQVCRVWLNQVEHCHVDTRFMHSLCGHLTDKTPNGDLECKFCCTSICNADVERTFHLKITIADDTTKVFAWCIGQTAAELLQISPDEFFELPEEEQIMYPSSLEHENFTVAIANCRMQDCGGFMEQDHDMIDWEITRAIKCDFDFA